MENNSMKNNKNMFGNPPATVAGTARSKFSAFWTALLTAVIVLSALGHVRQAFSQAAGALLEPGDIVYADSGNAIEGGFIIKIDSATGEKTVVSSGGYLQMPFDLVITAEGKIIVSDSGRLIGVEPENGDQTIIADNSEGPLGWPFGITLTAEGDVLAANAQDVVRVDLTSGQIDVVSAGGSFVCPLAVAVATGRGQAYVLNMAFPPEIIRVNLHTGAQKVISRGGFLNRPQAIAVAGDDIYVTDVATPDGNFGIGRVIHVDGHTGRQAVLSEAGLLVGPVGIAVDDAGQLIVGDPYTINEESADLFAGAIIRIDPATGTQTLITRGWGSVVNPRGVAIVPGPDHSSKAEDRALALPGSRSKPARGLRPTGVPRRTGS